MLLDRSWSSNIANHVRSGMLLREDETAPRATSKFLQTNHVYPECSPSTGKRRPDAEVEGAPRAKRRFERMSQELQHLNINGTEQPACNSPISSTSSSDEFSPIDDDVEFDPPETDTQQPVIVEEPSDADDAESRLRLDRRLQEYLEKVKANPDDVYNWMRLAGHTVSPSAVTVWRPPVTVNPLDDPSMKGRIREVDEESNEPEPDGDVYIDEGEYDWRQNDSPVVVFPEDEVPRGNTLSPPVGTSFTGAEEVAEDYGPISDSDSQEPMDLD